MRLLCLLVLLAAGCGKPPPMAVVEWIENQVEIDGTVIASGATMKPGNRIDVFPKRAAFQPETGASRVRFLDGTVVLLRATDNDFVRLQLVAAGEQGASVSLLEGRMGFATAAGSVLTVESSGRSIEFRDSAGIVVDFPGGFRVGVLRGQAKIPAAGKLPAVELGPGQQVEFLPDGAGGATTPFDSKAMGDLDPVVKAP